MGAACLDTLSGLECLDINILCCLAVDHPSEI